MKYKCSICGIEQPTRRHWLAHMKQVHNYGRPRPPKPTSQSYDAVTAFINGVNLTHQRLAMRAAIEIKERREQEKKSR